MAGGAGCQLCPKPEYKLFVLIGTFDTYKSVAATHVYKYYRYRYVVYLESIIIDSIRWVDYVFDSRRSANGNEK